MTRPKAVVWTDDLFAEAKAKANFRLTDADAWELATAICDQADALRQSQPEEATLELFHEGGVPDSDGWVSRMGRSLSRPDHAKLQDWINRVHAQRYRVLIANYIKSADDPGALSGKPPAPPEPSGPLSPTIISVRSIMGATPLHSDLAKDYFDAKRRSFNYRSALRQFRHVCGDKEIAQYTADDCWMFRKWLDEEARDEKRGQTLAGQTKAHKMSAARSLFDFAIEKRYRNDNPMRDVKTFSKNENIKKRRRLYTPAELEALFMRKDTRPEWQYWAPILGLYAGLRLREAIQLKPTDVSNEFEVWHIIVRPGRGQSVKGDRARVVPVHKELVRLGFLRLAKRALREDRDWLLLDVPLVEKPGSEFNAPDVNSIMVPSQNAATQWFGRYSDTCGVRDPNVDFHALRGAFLTYGSQQGTDLALRMQIAGHLPGSDVHSRYIYSGAPLKKLKLEIDKIRFPITIPTRA